MSQQLYFHCLTEDLEAIDKWFHERGFVFIKPMFITNENLILDRLDDYGSTHGWKVIYITTTESVENLCIHDTVSNKSYVDITSPRVFEFSRPSPDTSHKQMIESRLYYYHNRIYDEHYYELIKTTFRQFKSHFLRKLIINTTSLATENAVQVMKANSL